MSSSLFSQSWADDVKDAINSFPDDAYRATKLDMFWDWIDAARGGFTGSFVIGVRNLDGGPKYVVFSIDAGKCTKATVADAVPDDATYEIGDATLDVEHRPGHAPGHVWITERTSGAIFIGDYLLANMPTNAGMEIDRTQASGRAALLPQYNEGLRQLRERPAPVLLPAHGPAITDHTALIDKRLSKSDRRTRHVLDGLAKGPPSTALEIGRRLWGSRVEGSWEVLSDLVGRLDLLVARGDAVATMGEDGAWYFRATS